MSIFFRRQNFFIPSKENVLRSSALIHKSQFYWNQPNTRTLSTCFFFSSSIEFFLFFVEAIHQFCRLIQKICVKKIFYDECIKTFKQIPFVLSAINST